MERKDETMIMTPASPPAGIAYVWWPYNQFIIKKKTELTALLKHVNMKSFYLDSAKLKGFYKSPVRATMLNGTPWWRVYMCNMSHCWACFGYWFRRQKCDFLDYDCRRADLTGERGAVGPTSGVYGPAFWLMKDEICALGLVCLTLFHYQETCMGSRLHA